MNLLDWNFDQREFNAIEIIQIKFEQGKTDLADSCEKQRLLILSHQISQFGIPAIFLESSPKYVIANSTSNPVVIIFNIEDKFYSFSLPSFFTSSSFMINFENTFTSELANDLQRAFIIYYYYKYFSHSPLYHTSFLLFQSFNSWSEPFIFQYIPTYIQGQLRFRTLLITDLDIQVDCQNKYDVNSFILIAPYEHPFLIISTSETEIEAKYVDKTIKKFKIKEVKISRLLNPPSSLLNLFYERRESVLFNHDTCFFREDFIPLPLSKEELHEFIQKKSDAIFQMQFKKFQIESSHLEPSPPSAEVILSEQTQDQVAKAQIMEALGPLFSFPSKRNDNVRITAGQYATFLEKNYGTTNMEIPPIGKFFFPKSSVQFSKIEIPNVVVYLKNKLFEISAKDVINSWLTESFRPIFGIKNANFVVFSDTLLQENHVKQFFSHLSHCYSMLGFGELTPFSKKKAFYFSNSDDVTSNALEFSKENYLLEFTVYPVLFFLIVDKRYQLATLPSAYNIFISPHDVKTCNIEYLKELSFLIYSRIRLYVENPCLNLDINNNDNHNPLIFKPLDIFFGFRYKPPFLLKRADERTLKIHVYWDPLSTESVWSDDSGSTLHSVKMKNIIEITSAYNELKSILNDIELNLSIGLLMEMVPPKLIEPIQRIQNVNIFTIMPAPFVQINHNSKVDEDSIVFADYEQTSDFVEGMMRPLASCYVIPKKFPAYILALYFSNTNTNNIEALKLIATELSSLSWLSVKPGAEKRTIGYPPGLNVLLQKTRMNFNKVVNFEFLPNNDIT